MKKLLIRYKAKLEYLECKLEEMKPYYNTNQSHYVKYIALETTKSFLIEVIQDLESLQLIEWMIKNK